MTAATLLDTLVDNQYDSPLQATALTLASAYTGIEAEVSDTKDMGLALLALRALKTRKESNADTFPADFGKLMTDEIKDLLYDKKDSTHAKIIFHRPSSRGSGFV